MPRRKSPQEKKALSYRKDYKSVAEYPHAFRQYWPLKEARANRKYRRQVRQIVSGVARPEAVEDRDDLPLRPVRRDFVRKWRVVSLAEWAQQVHKARVSRTCWNYFKNPYQSGRDRERFMAFLDTLTEGGTAYSRELAFFFNQLLEPPEIPVQADFIGPPSGFPFSPGPRAWLRAFFRDEPEWEFRLRAWIASMAADIRRTSDE
jgi:hypothetical protein